MQFTIRTLILATAAVAVALSIDACTGGMLWRMVAPKGLAGYTAVMLLLASVCCSVACRDRSIAVPLAIIAWNLAMIDILAYVVDSFIIIGTPKSFTAQELEHVYRSVVSGLTLPLLLSIPVVFVSLSKPRTRLSSGTKWFAVALLVALLDVCLITQTLVTVLGYESAGGIHEWSLGPD